jgi:hypothetical protein
MRPRYGFGSPDPPLSVDGARFGSLFGSLEPDAGADGALEDPVAPPEAGGVAVRRPPFAEDRESVL